MRSQTKPLFLKSIPLVCLLLFFFQIMYSKPAHIRIISLSPILTEEIYQLGCQSNLIADTIYCVHPEDAKHKEKIGDLITINLEKIYKLNPDLVMASGLNDPKQLEKLREMNIPVEVFLQPSSFQGICDQFIRLSKLLNKEDSANKIVRSAQMQVRILRNAASLYPKKKVFVQIGSRPLFTVSKDSFINDFIVFGNGINIAEDSGVGFYSLEMVLKKDPDVIIMSDMGIDDDQERKIWNTYRTISAVKQNAVFSVDSYHLCSPTPASFAPTLEEIIRMVHPEFPVKRKK